jgi:hypothetical protein
MTKNIEDMDSRLQALGRTVVQMDIKVDGLYGINATGIGTGTQGSVALLMPCINVLTQHALM